MRIAIGRPYALFAAFPHRPILPAIQFVFLVYAPALLLAGTVSANAALTKGFGSTGVHDRAESLAQVLLLATPWLLYSMLPVFVAASAFVQHAVARASGSAAPFSATFRMVCYLAPVELVATVLACLLAITPSGGLVGFVGRSVWMACAAHGGIRRIHGISSGRATLVVVSPILLLVGCLFGPPLVISLLFGGV